MIRQNKGSGKLVKVQVAPGVWMKVPASKVSQRPTAPGTAPKRGAPARLEGARVNPLDKIIDVPKVVEGTGLGGTRPTSPEVGTAPMDLDGPRLDDFTEIIGVGKATDKALHKHGIDTFEQLLACDVSFLNNQGQKAVESWRASM